MEKWAIEDAQQKEMKNVSSNLIVWTVCNIGNTIYSAATDNTENHFSSLMENVVSMTIQCGD